MLLYSQPNLEMIHHVWTVPRSMWWLSLSACVKKTIISLVIWCWLHLCCVCNVFYSVKDFLSLAKICWQSDRSCFSSRIDNKSDLWPPPSTRTWTDHGWSHHLPFLSTSILHVVWLAWKSATHSPKGQVELIHIFSSGFFKTEEEGVPSHVIQHLIFFCTLKCYQYQVKFNTALFI